MKIINSKFTGEEKFIRILPFGDWHLGHVNCDVKLIEAWLNELNETNRGLLMGDLMECATKTSVGKAVFDTTLTPKEQKEFLVKLLTPKAQFIDACVKGNHEDRIENDTSIDLIHDMCKELGIPYLYQNGIVKYSINGFITGVQIWHGTGSGCSISSALKAVEDMANRSLADIYCMGHVHKKATSNRIFTIPDFRNMKGRKIEQHFVLTGSALKYDEGYGEAKGLMERGTGYPIIEIRGDRYRKINVII